MIDGKTGKYVNYVENSLNESEFLDLQIQLVSEAKNRMIDIFKD